MFENMRNSVEKCWEEKFKKKVLIVVQ